MRQIILENIKGKDRVRGGVKYPGLVAQGQHAIVVPGYSITLYGMKDNQPYSKTFKIGDEAEYDSYNLSYIGTITSITEKRVVIRHGQEKHSLDLYTFNWRNRNFDLERARKENAETSLYI